MTRLTAAILLGLAALPAHPATAVLHCDCLFDSRSGKLHVNFVMKDGVVYRTPTP